MLKAYQGHGFDLEELLERGYTKSPTLLDGVDTADHAQRIIEEMGDKTYCEKGVAHQAFLSETAIDELAHNLFTLAKNRLGYSGSIDNQYHIARHVVPAHRLEKFRTHYDSHLFTVVMPLRQPDNSDVEPDRGQLYLAPKHRRLPTNDLQNTVQKLLAKRYAGQGGYDRGQREGIFMKEDFSDGQPLLFLGKQTLHGNRNVGALAASSRLTVMAHFFDDAGSAGIGSLLRLLRPR